MLELAGVGAGYAAGPVLFDVSLEVRAGQLVTLLGRNGMGKTTTVNTVMGQLRPTAGVIRLDGAVIAGSAPHTIARRGIGLVPEGRQVFPNLTVEENLIATATPARGGDRGWTLERVQALFPRLRERRRHPGDRLSGGEQQMLAIGRALMTNPRLLILDEATEGLAPLVRREIWEVLGKLRASGLGILVIDKNVAALKRLADRHYLLEKGRIVWQGSSHELDAAPAVAARYLGV
jgi:branched-chain amino acid transport system ATP-binding protein